MKPVTTQGCSHTPSIAFRHLPPNLPDLVTLLKGHSYGRAAVHPRSQRPPKGLDTGKTVEAT